MGVIAAVARLTCREAVREGAFLLLGAAAALLILVSQFLPYFGDPESEVKLVKDMGFASIALAGIAAAILHATALLSEEVESRTAQMVLAKPVSRWAFVAGKYAGILLAEILLFAALGALLAWTVWRKASYVEGSFQAAPFDISVVQGVALAWLEVAVLAAVAVGVSGWMGAAPAALAATGAFLAGHLAAHLPLAAEAPWRWLAAAMPDLSLFRLDDAIALGIPIPWTYLGAAAAHAAACAAFALSLGAIGLDRREAA